MAFILHGVSEKKVFLNFIFAVFAPIVLVH